jgi:hypothetical protein
MVLNSVAMRAFRSKRIGPPTDAESTLPLRIQSAISRREELGLLFLDEVEDRATAIRNAEIKVLAPMLGEPKDVTPLSGDEKTALRHQELKSYGDDITTITNRLQDVGGLHIPDKPEEYVGGLYLVVGDYDATDLLILSIPGTKLTREDKVLGGVTGAGDEVITGSGHDQNMYVTPLTSHAVGVLGKGRRSLGRRFLQPVTLKEIQDLAPQK